LPDPVRTVIDRNGFGQRNHRALGDRVSSEATWARAEIEETLTIAPPPKSASSPGLRVCTPGTWCRRSHSLLVPSLPRFPRQQFLGCRYRRCYPGNPVADNGTRHPQPSLHIAQNWSGRKRPRQLRRRGGNHGDCVLCAREVPLHNQDTRACHQLSQTMLAMSWTAARKLRAVFS
jgi:hypothetical protein